MTITELVSEYLQKARPIGVVLPEAVVLQAAVDAARKYAGYGYIASLIPPEPEPEPEENEPASDEQTSIFGDYLFPPVYSYPVYFQQPPKIKPGKPIAPVEWVNEGTALTQSEWSVIRPLFLLYVEREQALYQEASRNLGVEVFGRTTSEIQQDIDRYEERLPSLAFCQPVLTV